MNTDVARSADQQPVTSEHQAASAVAVVIVCRNALGNLRDTLASLAALQGEVPLPIYIIDGASTDGTPAYLANCPYLLARWLSEPDRGIYDAMNKGWNMVADDAFVLYLGAGDKLLALPPPEHIAEARTAGFDAIIGTCRVGTAPFRSHWDGRLMLHNTAHHQALMIHKSVCPRSPFDAGFKVYGDWEFNLRLFVEGRRALWRDDFVSYALPGGVSARHHLGEAFRIAARHGGLLNGIKSWLRNGKAEIKLRRQRRRETAGHA